MIKRKKRIIIMNFETVSGTAISVNKLGLFTLFCILQALKNMLAFLTHLSYNKNRIIIYWETPDIISGM